MPTKDPQFAGDINSRHTGGGKWFPQVRPDAEVSAQPATATLTSDDFGKNLTNTGASGTITLTLPPASENPFKIFRFIHTVSEIVNLSPQSDDAIFLGGDGVDDKDLILAGIIGNYVDVYCDGVNYLVTGYSGVVVKES